MCSSDLNKYSYPPELTRAAESTLKLDEGLQVMQVLDGSGAMRAGIRRGDLLQSLQDQPLPRGAQAENEAARLIGPLLKNVTEIRVGIERQGKPLTLQVPGRHNLANALAAIAAANAAGVAVADAVAALGAYAGLARRFEIVGTSPSGVTVIDDFMAKLARVKPYLIAKEPAPADGGEYRQTPAQLKRFKQYSMCINCMLCYAACPQYGLNPKFTGPAALALLGFSALGLVGLPLSFDGERPPFAKTAPSLGEDNAAKLG